MPGKMHSGSMNPDVLQVFPMIVDVSRFDTHAGIIAYRTTVTKIMKDNSSKKLL